jgi:FdhD protein
MPKPTVVREPARALGADVRVLRLQSGAADEQRTDAVAVEEPLEIRLNGWCWTITMRTPGDDADLVVGLLTSEGVITRADEVERIMFTRHPDEPDLANVVDVGVRHSIDELRARLTRHQVTSASCGLCGASTIEALTRDHPPLDAGPTVAAATIARLPDLLAAAQPVFRATGGLHAAALFDVDGSLLVAREDIGRHNATDKVLGWRLRHRGAGKAAAILLVSGRASFEIVQKALVARVPIVTAVSAPSSMAVALAVRSGMTLAGFVRGGSVNVYAGADRVTARTDDSLEFIPRAVRTVLDAVALKISLVDWQALTLAERGRLVALAADARPHDFARYLTERTIARTGKAPRPLAKRSQAP